MANIEVTITAGDADLGEIRVRIAEDWVTRKASLKAGKTVTSTGPGIPNTDWVFWVVDGPSGAKFKIQCIADGNERWNTERTIATGKPFHSGFRQI